MRYFRSADLLIPKNCDLQKWAVIACDQYTSQPEYWNNAKRLIESAPSTLQMFFPEADLESIQPEDYAYFCQTMERYLENDFFQEFSNSYIYVERTLKNGMIRPGIVGVVDLEYYDYAPNDDTKIFATEATVLQRVPPRVALRKDASLEFSHTVVFCDDEDQKIIEAIAQIKDQLAVVYDFDLMLDGGHITGYLLCGDHAVHFEKLIAEYERNHTYLVGDGNHSLVTAKLCYQALKEASPNLDFSNHPARYSMIELQNIHGPSMIFEPIYRIAVCKDAAAFISALQSKECDGGIPVTWIHGEDEGVVHMPMNDGELIIEALQRFLDDWAIDNFVTIDYIHGADSVRALAQNLDTVGLLVPDIEKTILFPYILSGKVMPKKTFSIGHASEKRYYLEGRKIK